MIDRNRIESCGLLVDFFVIGFFSWTKIIISRKACGRKNNSALNEDPKNKMSGGTVDAAENISHVSIDRKKF